MGKKFDEMLRLMDSGTRNIVQSANDEYCKKNAEFRAKAGLEVLIIRESLGECCSWCSDLEGVYTYDTAPDDVYARHRDCNCVVSTRTKKGSFQDAWSKKEYKTYRENRIARAEEILKQNENLNEITQKKLEKIINAKTQKGIDEVKTLLKNIGLEASGYFDKINQDVANVIVNEIENVFSVFGNLHDKGTLNGIRVIKNKNAQYYASYSPPMKEINLLQHRVQYKNSIAVMKEDAAMSYQAGYWSSSNGMHSLRHELGHAIEKTLSSSQINQIEQIRLSTIKETGIVKFDFYNPPKVDMMIAGTKLSYYSLKNTGEFIAESVAEYLNGGPREIAKSVVDIILGG